MTVLYYYFFIAKDRLKSIRENILYSKSLRKVLGNIVLFFISLIAIPISYSRFLIYLANWILMSLISSGLIENKIMQFMLLGLFFIFLIEIVGLLIISVLGWMALSFWILVR
ncbi:Uncharacterised protein [Streptococcus pneumoniae]|nr:Uncharacterised protein [Streptococcus pneumoniae]